MHPTPPSHRRLLFVEDILIHHGYTYSLLVVVLVLSYAESFRFGNAIVCSDRLYLTRNWLPKIERKKVS